MMPVCVREMRPDEAGAVAALVGRVFDEHVAPLYNAAGTAAFHRYAAATAIAARRAAIHLVLVTEDDAGRLVAAAEIRGSQHLAMFFVETGYQRQGVGRALLAAVVARCRQGHPTLERLTVHASPNAVAAYRRLGFRDQGPEQKHDGIRYTPMALHLTGPDAA